MAPTTPKLLRLNPERMEKVERLAALHGGNRSHAIRAAIDLYYDRNHHVVNHVAEIISKHGRED